MIGAASATISLALAILAATACAREGDVDVDNVRTYTMVALGVCALVEAARVVAFFWNWP